MTKFNRKIISALIVTSSLLPLSAAAYALGPLPPASSGGGSDSNAHAQNQAQHLAQIKSKGTAEIDRRLESLGTLNSKISSATKLTASDKSTLSAEVSSEISGLTTLKSQLENDTTVEAAINDAKSVVSGYRVYALVGPKIMIIKTADDQQVVQAKLTTLADKLASRLTQAQSSGKDVTSLQSALSDLNAQVGAASAISSSIESKVISLQPTDYNSDHSILSGYRDQLKTARADDQKAITDAKTIVKGLESL